MRFDREIDQPPQCCSAILSKVCRAYSPAIRFSKRISNSSLVNMVIISVLMRAEDYCQPLPTVHTTPYVCEHHCLNVITLEPSLHFRLGLKLISLLENLSPTQDIRTWMLLLILFPPMYIFHQQ